MRYSTRLSILLCASVLTACGGGSGGGSNNTSSSSSVISSSVSSSVLSSSSSSVSTAPIANAGADQTLALGETVTLDASASAAVLPDASLSYQWSFIAKPASSAAVLSDAAIAQPTFVADVPGTYEVEVSVSDGTSTATDRVVILVTNDSPIAVIQTEYNQLIGTTLMLDASESIAPTGTDLSDLTFEWKLIEKPAASRALFGQSTIETNSLLLDVAGSYKASLVIHYQDKSSAPVELLITANNSNTKPVADAGGPYTVVRGQTITLDGSASSDADGDELSYRWYLASATGESGTAIPGLVNGSALRVETAITGANTATPSITPDVVGNWTLYLVVYDGTAPSQAASARITVTKPEEAANTPPVASFSVSPRFNFFTPADSTEAELSTIVWSSGNSWDIDGTYIGTANRKFRWISTPAGYEQADLSTSGSFSFTPTVAGDYTVELTVNDGESDGLAPARRTFTARTGANLAPTAAISVDSGTLLMGETAWFDGRTSADRNNDALTYHWYIYDKPDGSNATLRYEDVNLESGAVLKNARAGIVTDKPGAYIVFLAVSDSHGVTSQGTTVAYGRVLAKAQNNVPTVSIPGAQSSKPFQHNPAYPYWGMDPTQPAYTGAAVVINPIYTDPDLDQLYYLWTLDSQPAGSDLPLAATTSYHMFTPTVPGDYTYTVIASDGMATSEAQTITVTVADVAAYPSLKLSGDEVFTGETVGVGSIPEDLATRTVGNDGTFTLPFRTTYNALGLTVMYKLTAQGGDYTITGIDLTTEYPGTGSIQLIGLTEGQVIKNGESVNFATVSPSDFFSNTQDAHFRWQFKIKEREDWSFDLDFTNTKRN